MVSIEQQIKQTNKPIALDTSDTQSLNKNYLKKTFMYLLTIVGLWLFWKYLKPKYAFLYSCFPKKTNSLSIEELTLQKIVALEQRSWIKEGQLNIFYQEISWIIRNFIEKKWSINAPELTTEEFLAKVQIHPLFSTPERLSLQQFLEESDLVKFSKWIPEQKQAYKVLSYAKAFIIR